MNARRVTMLETITHYLIWIDYVSVKSVETPPGSQVTRQADAFYPHTSVTLPASSGPMLKR
jgi:hypothetical protein